MEALVSSTSCARKACLGLALLIPLLVPSLVLATPRVSVRMRRFEQIGRADSVARARSGAPRPAVAVAIDRSACPAFLEPDAYPQAGHVLGTAIADFDGDGRPDVAAALVGDSVRVLSNLGDGRFGPGRGLALADRDKIAAADLNGDGRPDLVVGAVYFGVLLNDGAGGLPLDELYPANLPYWAGITVADMNGDGSPDLVLPDLDSLLVIHLNEGDGKFRRTWVPDGPDRLLQVAVADLDRDGRPDLVERGQLRGWTLVTTTLLNRGDGAFVRRDEDGYDAPFALADFDGDSIPDLAIARVGDSLVIRHGRGDGSFDPPVGAGVALDVQNLVVADLDADGRADLVGWSVAQEAPVVVLRGLGAGRFARIDGYALGDGARGVSAADVDGDGLPELVAGDADGALVVARSRGQGRLTARGLELAGDFPAGVVAADLDGDGRTDLATVTYWDNSCRVFAGRGDGTFDPARAFANRTYPIAIAAADVTGDGRPDLLTLSADTPDEYLSVLVNQGGGSFTAGYAHNLQELGYRPEALATADLDGDGAVDVVLAGAPAAAWMHDVPVAGFTGPILLPTPACDAIATGDLNGDGWPDLVASSSVGRLWVLLNDGRGGFPDTMGFECSTPAALAVADFDGDGRDDLAVGSWTQPRIAVFFSRADGSLRRGPDVATDPYLPTTVAAVPARPGAVADLFVAAYATGDGSSVLWLRNDGAGGFSRECVTPVASAANGVAVGDFDRDGALDLALSHGNTSRRQLYLSVALRPGPDARAVRNVTLFECHARPDLVRLAWRTDGALDLATLYRRSEGGAWTRRALLKPDARGLLSFEDAAVRPGVRYDYRIGLAWIPGEIHACETRVTVPPWQLALAGVRPNPAGDGARIVFELRGQGEARVQLLDVAGRVVRSLPLAGLAAGPHEIPLDVAPRLAPGVYILRLTEGGSSATSRVVVTR